MPWSVDSLVVNADDPLTPLALLAQAERTIAGLPIGALVAEFQARGLPLFLVGGSVRDAILGRLGNDLDFTTPARPDVISDILRGWAGTVWDTGIDFGTVSAAHRGQQV